MYHQTKLNFGVQIYSKVFQSHHSNGFIRLSDKNSNATTTITTSTPTMCYSYFIAILFYRYYSIFFLRLFIK